MRHGDENMVDYEIKEENCNHVFEFVERIEILFCQGDFDVVLNAYCCVYCGLEEDREETEECDHKDYDEDSDDGDFGDE